MTAQIIEIQPFHSGWQVRGVEAAASFPFFTGPCAVEHAIDYAWEGIAQRTGEIRLLARNGKIISAMAFEKSAGSLGQTRNHAKEPQSNIPKKSA